jgi:hypothetical protein
MRKLTVYQLQDGYSHTDFEIVKRQAESNYADALFRLANKLIKIDKINDMRAFLDENEEAFDELKEARRDIELIEDQDE